MWQTKKLSFKRLPAGGERTPAQPLGKRGVDWKQGTKVRERTAVIPMTHFQIWTEQGAEATWEHNMVSGHQHDTCGVWGEQDGEAGSQRKRED